MHKVKFTKLELEIIDDRLSLWDAISECLTDCAEGEEPMVEEAPRQVEERVIMIYEEGIFAREFDFDALSNLDRAILLDCVDGSTFFADWSNRTFADDSLSSSKAGAYTRARRSIEKKLKYTCRFDVY